MIGEMLLVRALRYQWLIAIAVLCGTMTCLMLLRETLLPFFAEIPTSRFVSVLHSGLPRSHAVKPFPHPVGSPVSHGSGPVLPVQAIPEETGNPTQRDLSSSHTYLGLIRHRRDLETQIADARQFLRDLPEAQPLSSDRSAANHISPTGSVQKPLHAEEVDLRQQLDTEKAQLDLLKSTNTDLHPDVVAAREKLADTQRQLDAALRREQGVPSSNTAPPLQFATDALNVSDIRAQAMNQLASLIHARTSIEAQIHRLEDADPSQVRFGTVASVLEADEPLQPLLVPQPLPAQTDAQKPVKFSQTSIRMAYVCCSAAVASMLAFSVACAFEMAGDHVAGPLSLQAQLPSGSIFVGNVPHMRDS